MENGSTFVLGERLWPISRKCILIVERNAALRTLFCEAIKEGTTHQPVLAASVEITMELAQAIKPDLFLLDYHLNFQVDEPSGIDLYDQLRVLPELEAVPVIIMSTHLAACFPEIEQRHLIGLAMPFELDDFLHTIEWALHSHQHQREALSVSRA